MKYKIILAIFVISLISSIALSLEKESFLCSPEDGCNKVTSSVYGSTLGIKNSYFGVIIFFLMSILAFSHISKPHIKKRRLIEAGIIVGSIIALYFLYLQEFVIEEYCRYCLVVDIGLLISLVIMIWTWKES